MQELQTPLNRLWEPWITFSTESPRSPSQVIQRKLFAAKLESRWTSSCPLVQMTPAKRSWVLISPSTPTSRKLMAKRSTSHLYSRQVRSLLILNALYRRVQQTGKRWDEANYGRAIVKEPYDASEAHQVQSTLSLTICTASWDKREIIRWTRVKHSWEFWPWLKWTPSFVEGCGRKRRYGANI